MKHDASLVVSGRLGWNGRYWATAPGLHEPCPGSAYQEQPPQPGRRVCNRAQEDLPLDTGAATQKAGELSNSIAGLEAPPPPSADQVPGEIAKEGLLPFVVSASVAAGLAAHQSAKDGFWHGYSLVRLDRSGDPRLTIVEQRPIFDWLQIDGASHVLRPRQKLTLRGIGREPSGVDLGGGNGRRLLGRFDAIENAGITHRYDLVEADPARPWLPRKSADGDYIALPADVAVVDSQTGRIRTGRGNHPRMFAIGVLSVGDHVATYPLVFESRRSFRPKPAQALPALPLPKVAASAAAAIQSPQAPPPVNPTTPQVDLPVPPTIPSLPTPSANPPAPPAPPAPPPPPVSPTATPLSLVTSPLGLNVAPQATVIPPPAPPIQPAPPGGARREARQRQAATQKSGADVGEGSGEAQNLGGDLADTPPAPQSHMTRRARERAEAASITATHHTQPSAWPRNLAYAGTLTLAAALLSLGWMLARPTPRRRRHPEHPAPALNRTRTHRRP